MTRRKSSTFFRLSCLGLCLLMLGGCGLIRRVTELPSPSEPAQPAEYERQETADRPVVADTAKAVVDVKPAVEKKAEPISVEDRNLQWEILKIAKSKLGSRYSSGGKGPNYFDCSGFTGWVFRQVGIRLGASSRDQYLQGRVLEKDEILRPGDLVFWNGRRVGSTVGHVGIVVDYDAQTGAFTFIHSSTSNGVEMQRSTAEYYARRYMGARRVLEDTDILKSVNVPAESPAPAATVEKTETEAAPAPAPKAEPEPVWHTIKSGDTLSALAVKYHTTVSKICSLNGISSKTILKIGRKLRMK